AARAEAVVACREVDSLVADEHGDLAFEDVEGLVLVVVDVEGWPAAAWVVDLELREGVAGLLGACFDGDAAGLPPDVGEALPGGEAIRLGGGFRGHGAPFGSEISSP